MIFSGSWFYEYFGLKILKFDLIAGKYKTIDKKSFFSYFVFI